MRGSQAKQNMIPIKVDFCAFIYHALVSSALIFLSVTPAPAEVLEFPRDLNHIKFLNLYELESKKKLHPLSAWRILEIERNYSECLKKAPSLFQKNKKLQGWIMAVWAQCQLKELEIQKDLKFFNSFLSTLEKNQELLDSGPWKNSLQSLSQKIFLWIINSEDKTKSEFFYPRIKNFIFNKYVSFNGELKKWAHNQTEKEFPGLNPKAKKEEKFNSENIIPLKAKEKLLNLDPFLKNQNIDSFKVDKEVLMELLNQSYKKMEYLNLIQVSSQIDKYIQFSHSYPNFLLMLGRSHQFTGGYEQAIYYFQKIINDYAEADETQEALFRSGLVYMRLKNYKEAKRFFETLNSLKLDRYDITGRYWWLKSLELTDDPRFLSEKKSFVFDYPYSYYGLKLQIGAEEETSSVFKDVSKIPNSKWEVLGEVEQGWNRFRELSQRGWLIEAQSEAANIPVPTNPVNIYYFSVLMSKAFQHPLSVKLMNQLLEHTHDIRNIEMLKSIYPLTYSQKIKIESEKYKINPVLIMSLIRQESAFGLRALSSSQAAGLMQMIQPTALEVAGKLKLKIQFPEDLYRPEINIPMGVFYYGEVLKEFNNHVPLALAGYNAGPHKIKIFVSLRDETRKIMNEKLDALSSDLWIDEMPWSETTGYVKSILRNSLIYQLIQGKSLSKEPDFWRDLVVITQ